MIEKLMKRYALTRKGAADFVKCTAITTIQNLLLMAPVAVLYYLTLNMIDGSVPKDNIAKYIVSSVVILIAFFVIFYMQYNSTVFQLNNINSYNCHKPFLL